jgi:hypothetical protein
VSRLQVRVVDACLNSGVRSVGLSPKDFIEGCYHVEGHVIIICDYLLLLVFELGQDESTFLAYASSSNVTIAVVVLTLRKGYKDCMFRYLSLDRDAQPFGLVRLGNPLVKVVYRDSKSIQQHTLAKNASDQRLCQVQLSLPFCSVRAHSYVRSGVKSQT